MGALSQRQVAAVGLRPAAVAALQAEDVSRAHLRLMLTGMPESEGLRFAGSRTSGLDLLTARRSAGLSTHPFYWAGFVAAGDWR